MTKHISDILQGINLFLSYSARDLVLAQHVKETLTKYGARVWLDTEEVSVSDRFRENLRNAIAGSHGMVALVTKHYLMSKWALIELGAGWVSGIPLFQVFSEIAASDVPLADLSSCPIEEIDTRLIKSISSVIRAVPTTNQSVIDETRRLVEKEIQGGLEEFESASSSALEIARGLLSPEIAKRIASQDLLRKPSDVTDEALLLLLELVDSFVDHVRAEACFSLGSFANTSGKYLVNEKRIARGLLDENLWVAACCAAALRVRAPLKEETISLLKRRIGEAQRDFQRDPNAPAFCFRAREAIEAHLDYQRSR